MILKKKHIKSLNCNKISLTSTTRDTSRDNVFFYSLKDILYLIRFDELVWIYKDFPVNNVINE